MVHTLTEQRALRALGSRLKAARVARGYSQRGLAQALGMTSHKHVSEVERGKRNASVLFVVHLCEVLEIVVTLGPEHRANGVASRARAREAVAV